MIGAGGAVEVGVTAIHIDELAGGMAAARGGEKYDGVGHLLRSGHAMAERDELLNAGASAGGVVEGVEPCLICLLYTSPSPRDRTRSRMPSSA